MADKERRVFTELWALDALTLLMVWSPILYCCWRAFAAGPLQ
jgi:hypothetical protein